MLALTNFLSVSRDIASRSRDITSIMTARCIPRRKFSRLSGLHTCQPSIFLRVSPAFYARTVPKNRERLTGLILEISWQEYPTLMDCLVLAFPICRPTVWSANADGDGWVMSSVWRMVALKNNILRGYLALGKTAAGNLRPAGQIRPTKGWRSARHPTRQ